MRHTYDDFFNVIRSGSFNHGVEGRNAGLSTFQWKSFWPTYFIVKKFSNTRASLSFFKGYVFFRLSWIHGGFKSVCRSILSLSHIRFFMIFYMWIFKSNMIAINALKFVNYSSQLAGPIPMAVPALESCLHVWNEINPKSSRKRWGLLSFLWRIGLVSASKCALCLYPSTIDMTAISFWTSTLYPDPEEGIESLWFVDQLL